MKTKDEIRKKMLRKLKAQSAKLKTEKDKIIRERLLSLPEFKKAKVIAFYISFGSEVDTKTLIDNALSMGKRVVVPFLVKDEFKLSEIGDVKIEMAKGPYGIAQPTCEYFRLFPQKDIDLIIVPGIAFGNRGSRLGRGKGFYDRFLPTLPGGIKKIGLAYDFQVIKDLPVTTRDIPVDVVITG